MIRKFIPGVVVIGLGILFLGFALTRPTEAIPTANQVGTYQVSCAGGAYTAKVCITIDTRTGAIVNRHEY